MKLKLKKLVIHIILHILLLPSAAEIENLIAVQYSLTPHATRTYPALPVQR